MFPQVRAGGGTGRVCGSQVATTCSRSCARGTATTQGDSASELRASSPAPACRPGCSACLRSNCRLQRRRLPVRACGWPGSTASTRPPSWSALTTVWSDQCPVLVAGSLTNCCATRGRAAQPAQPGRHAGATQLGPDRCRDDQRTTGHTPLDGARADRRGGRHPWPACAVSLPRFRPNNPATPTRGGWRRPRRHETARRAAPARGVA